LIISDAEGQFNTSAVSKLVKMCFKKMLPAIERCLESWSGTKQKMQVGSLLTLPWANFEETAIVFTAGNILAVSVQLDGRLQP
jgi:hypothetical protein